MTGATKNSQKRTTSPNLRGTKKTSSNRRSTSKTLERNKDRVTKPQRHSKVPWSNQYGSSKG